MAQAKESKGIGIIAIILIIFVLLIIVIYLYDKPKTYDCSKNNMDEEVIQAHNRLTDCETDCMLYGEKPPETSLNIWRDYCIMVKCRELKEEWKIITSCKF